MATATNSKFKNVPVEKLRGFIQTAKNARKDYETDWDKNKQFYEGKHWTGKTKIAWFQSEPIFNKIFEFVTTMRAYNADNKWGVDCIPASVPEDQTSEVIMQQASRINQLLDFIWIQTNMQIKLAEVLHFVFLYGTAFLKVAFDPDDISDSGIGQIEVSVVSPRYIFPDPFASSVQDADYIIEHHAVSYRWAIGHYPDLMPDIVASGESARTQYQEGRGGADASAPSLQLGKSLDIYEVWYKDSTMEEEDGEEAKPKYEKGRHTVVTEGGLVLEDGPCLYSNWPYIRFVEIARPGEFFGDCTVSKVIPIQENINQILRTIIDNGLWLVHGIWIADTTSGVTPKTLTGYGPRDTIMKHPGTEVRRDSGAQLPGHIFQMLEQQVDAFDLVAGFPNVLRGDVPSRQPVKTTMIQKESGEVRVRERQRRVEDGLADLGRAWLDIVANHWSDGRTISTKNPLGSFDMFQLSKADFEQWKWDIQIVPGSTGPFDKTAMLQMLKEAKVDVGIPIPDMYFVRQMGAPGLEAAMLEQANQLQENQGPPPADEGGEQQAPPPPAPEQIAPAPEALPPMPAPAGGGLPPELAALMGGVPPQM